MKNKGKIIIISILATLFIGFIGLVGYLAVEYSHYTATNTWATIAIEEDGELKLTQECLKGDTLTVGDVIVKIMDISTKGEVKLKVQSGNLYDKEGNVVKKFTINLSTQAHFTTDEGTINIQVVSNQFR